MNKQEKILNSAKKIFIEYGFHGSTLMKIATDANVSKAAIHYYYRSKESLYNEVIEKVCQSDLDEEGSHYVWFLITELRNNRVMFLSAINEIGNDVCLSRIKKYIYDNMNKLIFES